MLNNYLELIEKEINKKIFQEELKRKDFRSLSERLMKIFNKCYNTDGYVDRQMLDNDSDQGYVFAPGIIKSKKTGEYNLALLDISLNDGGEHMNTLVFVEDDIVSLHGKEKLPEKYKHLLVYDYMPLIYIHGDHHIDYNDYSMFIEAGIITEEELEEIKKDYDN